MKAKTTAITDKKKQIQRSPEESCCFSCPCPSPTLATFSTFGFDFLPVFFPAVVIAVAVGWRAASKVFVIVFAFVALSHTNTPTHTGTHTHAHWEPLGNWPRPKCVLWCIKKFLERSPHAACQTFCHFSMAPGSCPVSDRPPLAGPRPAPAAH